MQLVCLDLEGVLVPEIWIEFSKRTGIPELMRTTRDEPDYDKLMTYRLNILRPAIGQHLANTDAERVFIQTGPLTVTGYRQNLGPGRMPSADAGIPLAAIQRDQGGCSKGFNVIDDGRLVEIAVGDREWRPVTRRTALAFE